MEQDRENPVWQRVMGTREITPSSNLQGLIRDSGDMAAVYRRAAEKLAGREKQLARKLLEMEQSNTARLRGIAMLAGEKGETLKHWEPAGGFGKQLLMKCYHRSLHMQAEYAAMCLNPEYGEVYRGLADRLGQQCGLIAELIGRIS